MKREGSQNTCHRHFTPTSLGTRLKAHTAEQGWSLKMKRKSGFTTLFLVISATVFTQVKVDICFNSDKEVRFERVKPWTRRMDLLEKSFVFVPVFELYVCPLNLSVSKLY